MEHFYSLISSLITKRMEIQADKVSPFHINFFSLLVLTIFPFAFQFPLASHLKHTVVHKKIFIEQNFQMRFCIVFLTLSCHFL